MISRRAQHEMRSDLTKFFSSFFREYEQKTTNGMFDLSIGNVCGIPAVEETLLTALKHVGQKVSRLTKYPGTQGYFPLNQKIAELVKRETKKTVNPEDIILTNGALDGLYQLFYTMCNPGDYFYYCSPSFPYWSPADKAGVKSSVVVYKNPFDYAHTYGSIFQKKVQQNKLIKLAVVNEPHNPIGKSLEPEQVNIFRDTAEDNNVQVILDEVYRSFASERRWIGESFDNAVMVDSFSKRFGMPGLRLGFIHAPKEIVPYVRAGMANQVVGMNMLTALVADHVLDVALTTNFTKVISREIARRQNKLDKSLRKISSYGIVSHLPDGGIYRLLALNGIVESSKINAEQLCQRLGANHVKVVPGSKLFAYGTDPSRIAQVVRLSVGGEPRTAEAGEKIVETIEGIGRR